MQLIGSKQGEPSSLRCPAERFVGVESGIVPALRRLDHAGGGCARPHRLEIVCDIPFDGVAFLDATA